MIHQHSRNSSKGKSSRGRSVSDRVAAVRGRRQLSLDLGVCGGSDPAISNSGVKTQMSDLLGIRGVEVGIDWLAFSFPRQVMGEVMSLVRASWWRAEFQADTDQDVRPFRGYNCCLLFKPGILFSWHENRRDAHVNISGVPMSYINAAEATQFVRAMVELGANCTRIDVRADDYTRSVTPQDMDAWVRDGQLCGFRKAKYVDDYEGGVTFYAGRRGRNGCGKFFRCYDKFAESNGKKNCIRHEVEFSQHKSRTIAHEIASGSPGGGLQRLANYLFGLVIGALDFRVGRRCRSKNERLRNEKWEDFCHGSMGHVPACPKPIKKDGFNVSAFVHQWGKKLDELTDEDPCENKLRKVVRMAVNDGRRRRKKSFKGFAEVA